MNNSWLVARICAVLIDVLSLLLSRIKKSKTPWAVLFSARGAEYFLFGRRTGRLAGESDAVSFIMTMMFGAAWWLPKNDETHRIKAAAVAPGKFADKGAGIRFVTD